MATSTTKLQAATANKTLATPTTAATTEQYFSLRWNHYQTNLSSVFHQLLESQSFVDVSLACEEHTLQAHKVVLSSCSTFFKRILLDNPCKHPTIIMPAEVEFDDLRAIVEFIYRGEVDVPEGSLQGILQTAEQLQIRGLSDYHDMAEFTNNDTHLEVNNIASSNNQQHLQQHHIAGQTTATPSTISGAAKPMPQLYQRPAQSPNRHQQQSHAQNHPNLVQPQATKSASTDSSSGITTSFVKLSNARSASETAMNSASPSTTASPSAAAVTSLTTRRPRAKRARLESPVASSSCSATTPSISSSVVSTSGGRAVQTADTWTFSDVAQLQSVVGTQNGQDNNAATDGSAAGTTDNVYIRMRTSTDRGEPLSSSVVGVDVGDDDCGDGNVMGVSMGFLDFAAEPAAPTATPVMDEQTTDDGGDADGGEIGSNGSRGVGAQSHDDLSDVDDDDNDDVVDEQGNTVHTLNEHKTATEAARTMQFQTLHPMDQTPSSGANAATAAEGTHATHGKQRQHHAALSYQQSQTFQPHVTQHGVDGGSNETLETIVISTDPSEHDQQQLNQHHQHHHQHHLQQQEHQPHMLDMHVTETLDDSTAQEITIDPDDGMMMEMDAIQIKSELPQHQQQNHHLQHLQQAHQHQQQLADSVLEVDTSADVTHHESGGDSHMVTMMTSGGHLVELYQSDESDDSKLTDLHDISGSGSSGDNNSATAAAIGADDEATANEMHFLSHIPTSTPLKRSASDAPHGETNASAADAAAGQSQIIVSAAGPKTWTQANMDAALASLRAQSMSLTKASVTFGIPSTTLWQRAHRLGIDTPKKEGPSKTWSDDSLNNALEALRNGEISANKASKAYGIPSSTLYKIARREGIRLAAPFNAAPTNWSVEDLERALESIRSGATSVQKASLVFGIPTGTLYGRCKREGIELSRSNPTPWSEENMTEALESVRIGMMSINQAAINFNLPYSSLYGRFKRGKFDAALDGSFHEEHQLDQSSENSYEYTTGSQQQQQQHQQPQQTDQPQVVYLKTEQS